MKISILAPNLSSNLLSRVYPIAKILQRHYEIEVIGPVFDGEVYPPYKDAFPYVRHPVDAKSDKKIEIFLSSFYKPYRSISGDVVYAFKPRLSSFGCGLLAKFIKHKPLLLDIDDWEAEPYYSSSWSARVRRLWRLYNPEYCWWYCRALESFIKYADEKTVVSSFFLNRYGGIKLPQTVDINFFDPEKYNRKELRSQWGVDHKKVIVFTGNVISHKGLDTLINALELLKSKSIVLWIIGNETPYLNELRMKAKGMIFHLPPQPHDKMPEFLSLCDLVVLPQKNVPYAYGQVPAKIVEAMSMAKPIIATNVSDLGEILNGCGWVVPPDDANALSEKIASVFDNSEDAEAKSSLAREKCIKSYSYEAAEKILLDVFKKYAF